MGSTDNSAIMTIDLKWNRFRIHKSTLNKMGNPQYVQFLVNPEEMFIAVLGSDRPLTGGTSNRVKLVQTSRHYSVEFYSNTLLCALVNMIGTLDFQYSYRMSGEVDVANRVAYRSGAILLMIHSSLPLPPTQGIKLFKMHLLSREKHPVTALIRVLLPQVHFPCSEAAESWSRLRRQSQRKNIRIDHSQWEYPCASYGLPVYEDLFR